MSKIIASLFASSGTPLLGLSPTIRIWEVDTPDVLVVVDAPMVEVGDGFYKYEFTTYDARKEYLFRTDGGAGLSDGDRYQSSSNRNSAAEVWERDASSPRVGSYGEVVNDISTDTTALRIDVTAALSVLDILLKYESNRTRVDPVANTLTIFDDDGTTVLQVFDLKDENGQPSSDCVYERDPQ